METIKRRLPEEMLAACDIMIKDAAESKRLDRQINEDSSGNNFHAFILSKHYWPEKDISEDDDMQIFPGLAT